MKTAEAKPTSVATSQKANQPFFSKEAEGSFFAESVDKEPSFFKRVPTYSINDKSVLQTKLTISQPNDIYEREADTTADKVVQRLSEPGNIQAKTFSSQNTISPFVQKKCAHCEEEEKKKKEEKPVDKQIRRKPIFESNEKPEDDFSLSLAEGRGEVQRKCVHCEEEEKLQKKSDTTSPTSPSDIESKLSSSKGSGTPLPAGTRSQMESSFGSDFSNVRIHNDSSSIQMSNDLNAQAFTHGSDIYFNSGKYNTSHTGGKHLLAHELTHVVQQSGGKEIQKQSKAVQSGSNDGNSQGVFLVDDNTSPSERQMNKTTFLERLKSEVCQTVDEAIKFTGSTSDNCPYIREVFARYQNNTPAQIEAVIQRYEPSTRFAQSAEDVIQMVKAHAFTAAIQWATNGVIPGLPESISSLITTGIASVSNVVSTISSTVNNAISSITSGISSAVSDIGSGIGNAVSSIGNLFFKSKPGGSQATQSPLGVMQSLGKGSPISSGARNKMESAFGTSFSHVQLHTDSKASALSGSMNARAFAVGNHIAFGSGEYQPGTLAGDALIAHELAHVIQQKETSQNILRAKSDSADSGYEMDADKSAYNFLINQTLPGSQKKSLRPKMKSGLSIHSCGKSSPPCSVAEAQTITTSKQTASGWVTAALVKLRTSPTPADVLTALQKNFGATDGVAANLPGIITKITTAETEMTTVPISCAGTEDSTCSKAPCGYTPGAGAHKYVICRNATLTTGSDPIYQSGCVLHEAFHSAFSDFSGDSYSGWGGHSSSTSGYPGSNPLKNADSYASLVIDLK